MTSRKQFSKTWDGIVSRHLNRRLSRPLAHLLATRTAISPNAISYLSFIVAVLAAVGFILGKPWLGGILAQTSSLLDGVDGDLAKERGKTSDWGAYLDSMLDRYADAALVISMALYATWSGGQPLLILLFALFAMTGTLLVSYTRVLSSLANRANFSSSFANYAGNRDVRLLGIAVGSILGFVIETLLFLAVLTNAVVVVRFAETSLKAGGSSSFAPV